MSAGLVLALGHVIPALRGGVAVLVILGLACLACTWRCGAGRSAWLALALLLAAAGLVSADVRGWSGMASLVWPVLLVGAGVALLADTVAARRRV